MACWSWVWGDFQFNRQELSSWYVFTTSEANKFICWSRITSSGKQFVDKLLQSKNERETRVSSKTREFIDALEVGSESSQRWKRAVEKVLATQSRTTYREHIQISMMEHMSSVDVFDGENVRKGLEGRLGTVDELGRNLVVVSPRIDGRLKDMAKSWAGFFINTRCRYNSSICIPVAWQKL